MSPSPAAAAHRAALLSGFVQSFPGTPSVGFYTPRGKLVTPVGNLPGNMSSAAIPAIPDVPTYGPQMAWNTAPPVEPADPLCRMLAYPAHCSLASAIPRCAQLESIGASQYPYSSNASVSLADGNAIELGNPGMFVPLTKDSGELERRMKDPKAQIYGNVESYSQFMTDKKDGPVRSCGVYFSCQQPVPSFAGYESASVDPTTLNCQPTYLQTVPVEHTKILPASAVAAALAGGPLMDSNTNAFLPGQSSRTGYAIGNDQAARARAEFQQMSAQSGMGDTQASQAQWAGQLFDPKKA